MFIANDLNQFKTLFVAKLKGMLSADELGAFILVLANSHQDDFLRAELKPVLADTFLALKKKYSAGSLAAPQDDMDVFEQLLELQLDDIANWQYKNTTDNAGWEIVCNAMRKMRPPRASSQVLHSIKQPYDEHRFHFNKAFLKPEILWQGVYKEKATRILFNKFPFATYHLLIVVAPEENRAQLLSQEMHHYAASLATEMAELLPGFGIGYNSLAAGASVNHLHFQGFIREHDFVIEKNYWLHNAGSEVYPLAVQRFTEAQASWGYIKQLTENDEAFNCLYRHNICYVVVRKYQATMELPEWLSGAGWIDVAGAITVSDEHAFNAIDGQSIVSGLGQL